MKKFSVVRRIAVVAGMSVASGGAMATSCDQVYGFLASCAANPIFCSFGSYANDLGYYQSTAPYSACFGASSPATSQQEITQTSFNHLFAINRNLGTRLLAAGGPTRTAGLGSGSGLAAGAAAGGWNAWASYSGDSASYRVSNVAVTGAAGSPFNIDNLNKVDNLVFGGDYRIAPSMVLGISAALDTANGYVNPNSTAIANRSNTSARGQSFAAYVGWQVEKNWAVDATIGGGTGVSNPAPRTTADSTRRFAGINLSYANWFGNWQVNGKAGYQFGAEQFDNSRRNVTLPLTYYTARLGQVKVAGEVGYWLGEGVMPYLGLGYVNDVSRNRVRVTQLWDDDGVVLTAGINFFSLKNNLSGGIVYTDETNRKFVGHGNWMANINYRF